MWKVCQVLKGGRSHISRSRNANSFSSPAQPSSSSSTHILHDDNLETCLHHAHSTKRPWTFTPSAFRSFGQKNRKCAHMLIRGPLFSVSDGNGERSNSGNFSDEQSGGEKSRSRPDHDHEGWDCRCRCRFGEWFGYTSLVAASIHLCRIINYTPEKEQIEICRLDSNAKKCSHITIFADFKDAFKNGWQQFLFRAAPVLFPDVFKRWYVLPVTPQQSITTSTSSKLEDRTSTEESAISTCDESPSTSSLPVSRTVSKADRDCAVQTDASGIGTPFDEFMLESGRRLAAITRMSDVDLEHTIGVDLLKRRLYDEAIDYLLGAARSGHAGALYNVGVCYSRGFGVRRDMTKAVEMWRAAADQGHGLSKYQMGVCHARGLGGLAMDHDRAMRYMEAAASLGVPEAKTYLAANEYKHGRLEGALQLLRQAMAGGDNQAKELLQEWPDKDSNSQRNDSNGYDFENLAKVKMALPAPSAAIKRINSGRRRFWASSSSDKEDSLSSSSSPQRRSRSSRSSSSVVFCDDDSLECENEKIMPIVEGNGSRAIETVASLLTLGSMRRSKTAPDFHGYDKPEVAIVTGNLGHI